MNQQDGPTHKDVDFEMDKLKNALRERLAQRKSAGENSLDSQPLPAPSRLGFGGRVINETNQKPTDPGELRLSNFISQYNSSHPPNPNNPVAPFGAQSASVSTVAFGDPTPDPQFMVDNVHKLTKAQRILKIKMKAAKKAKDGAALKEQKRLRVKAQQKALRFAKNKTKCDDCDRVQIQKTIYAVTDNGRELIPLLDSDVETSESVEWNKWLYSRKPNGTLIRAKKRIQKTHCRYFCRTGMC